MTYDFKDYEVACKTCSQPWPCGSIKDLRDYDLEQNKAHHSRMAESGSYSDGPVPW